MKALKILALTTAVAAISNAAFAADQVVVTDQGVATFSVFKPASVRLEVGTTGYGAAVSYSVNPMVGLTFGYDGGKLNYKDKYSTDREWKADFDMKNAYVTTTYRPTGGMFGIDAGVYWQDTNVTANTSSNMAGDHLVIGGQQFTNVTGVPITAQVTGKWRNQIAPFLGLSISPSITDRFGLFAQVGAIWQGKFEAKATTNSPSSRSDNLQTNLQTALNQEVLNKFRADNEKYSFLPVAKLGLQLRF